MVAIGLLNFGIAIVLFAKSVKQQRRDTDNAKYFLLLRVLGLLFVTVALYRTVFVSSYPNRLAWFDTLFNSPFVIRSMAFFAELSFIGMITVILRKLSKDLLQDKRFALVSKLPFVAFGCIALAQPLAFGGLGYQSLIMFAIEETLWAAAFISIVPVVIAGIKQSKKADPPEKGYKAFLLIMAVWCCGYLAFQCLFALPFMHYVGLAQDIGRVIPPDALWQSIFNYTATRDFSIWGGLGFFIWHSGYFSICAWMALFFMTAPHKQINAKIKQDM